MAHNGRPWFSYCPSISIAWSSQQSHGVIIDLLAISRPFLPLSLHLSFYCRHRRYYGYFHGSEADDREQGNAWELWLHAGSCLWSVHSPPLMNNVTAEAVLYQNATWRNITPLVWSIDSSNMASFVSIPATTMVTLQCYTLRTETASPCEKISKYSVGNLTTIKFLFTIKRLEELLAIKIVISANVDFYVRCSELQTNQVISFFWVSVYRINLFYRRWRNSSFSR